jgi:hypothetical protein
MSDNTFISTHEAAELVGVHKRTIQRRADGYLKSQGIAMESAKHLIDVREVAGKRKYFVSKEFVLKHLVQEGDSSAKAGGKDATFATKQMLRQLEIKDQQLAKKDDQLAAKDEQLGDLNERLRESHFLLKSEQELHLEAQKSKRPLISLAGGWLADGERNEQHQEGSRPSILPRIASASAIGFSTLVVFTAVVYLFL